MEAKNEPFYLENLSKLGLNISLLDTFWIGTSNNKPPFQSSKPNSSNSRNLLVMIDRNNLCLTPGLITFPSSLHIFSILKSASFSARTKGRTIKVANIFTNNRFAIALFNSSTVGGLVEHPICLMVEAKVSLYCSKNKLSCSNRISSSMLVLKK